MNNNKPPNHVSLLLSLVFMLCLLNSTNLFTRSPPLALIFFHTVPRFCYKKSVVMSKKSKGAAAEGPPPLLGRVGTSLKVGIVGLPNVGYVHNDS